jgi:hypothetical protein
MSTVYVLDPSCGTVALMVFFLTIYGHTNTITAMVSQLDLNTADD